VRELEGYLPTCATSDDHRRRRRQSVKKSGSVIHVVAQVHGLERLGTLAAEKAPAVIDDAPAPVAQFLRSVHPQQSRTRRPMNAQNRWPLAIHLVIEVDSVHIRFGHGPA
jgi:hypothetical protein